MKIVFMGTPEFAVPSLRILIENQYEVIAVITQADKPAGRGHSIKSPPVKDYAVSHGIKVIQPIKLSRQPEIVEEIDALKPDLFVTCAFGQILPKNVLDIPKKGTINVHGSLLPKYRGAAPIQWAIINGENQTGITTMMTDEGLDTGDMLLMEALDIDEEMTAGELHDKMSLLGAKVLLNTIKALENNRLNRIKQDDSLASYAPRITKDTGAIVWSKNSSDIHNLIRGTTPWPGAYTCLCGKKMRIGQSRIVDKAHIMKVDNNQCVPGTILKLDNTGMLVKTGDGALLINQIQVESCKCMTPWQYCCGHELSVGTTLGGSNKS